MQNEEKDAVTKHSYTFHFINANKEQNILKILERSSIEVGVKGHAVE